jgi:glycosyltransferase involved in cell wall biosynthesis
MAPGTGSRAKRTLHRPPRESAPSLAIVGTYVPRRCGIATFSADLVGALQRENPEGHCFVVALNDQKDGYDYGDEVGFEINEKQLQDYRAAADFLNASRVDAVSVQHEFGIFGGADGGYALKLLAQLRPPILTTLHTVLSKPSPSQRAVLREIGSRSDRVIVMSDTARQFLTDVYGVPAERVSFAPHGIPDVPFVDPSFYKDLFGVEGRKVVLTFGLLSRNKGIEVMVRALPEIARKHPEVVYIVLGATHPHVRRTEGEAYRLGLQQLARRLRVADRVQFHDRYVELDELVEFLGAADLYVTPYLNEEQIVSGTLAYAMGAGKAIVSTPYYYAREMLADGRGRLVPFGDADATAAAIIELLDDETTRHAMRKRAYTFARANVWSAVARRYLDIVSDVNEERSQQPRPPRPTSREPFETLPQLDFAHLRRLSDETGLLQHAHHHVPERAHGYCTDDNARALLVVVQALPFVVDSAELEALALRYFAFLRHAYHRESRSFRNFLGYDRRFLDERGSGDCQGRAAWALAITAAKFQDVGIRSSATDLLHETLPTLEAIADLRPRAYALLGLAPYLAEHGGDSAVKRTRQMLADRLFTTFQEASVVPDWPWPEDKLTYANAYLPQALIDSGEQLERPEMVERGLQALQWLMEMQRQDGRFSPVGNQGWFTRGAVRARFDQQPIEAHASVAACASAFRVTGDAAWLERVLLAFRWFLGENDAGQPLFDHANGGCRDGLHANGVNENEGAESTLAWIAALTQMHALEAAGQLGGRIATRATATVAAPGGP